MWQMWCNPSKQRSIFAICLYAAIISCNLLRCTFCLEINCLIVAGGGAGGNTDRSGGGGGGGVLEGPGEIEPDGSTSYALQVGAGGSGTYFLTSQGVDGYDSSFGGLQATGGGGGGTSDGDTSSYYDGRDGGSGGGASEQGENGHITLHNFELLSIS